MKNITLLIIFAIAIFFRLYHLTSNPPSLFSDEVDAGYQAMVFNHNGSDYFGNKFPVHFHSFSDFRTSLYIYSVALFQKFTHNSELSVRLPSAIFSILTVFVFWLITKSPLAAFLIAISPWSIHFGRTGFEVSGMLLMILLGLYFWQQHRLFLSSFFFCLSPYFYSTAKFFLVIIFFLIVAIWLDEIKKIKLKTIALVGLFSLLLLTPMLIDTVRGSSGFRFSYISIFTEPHREQITDTLRYEDIFSGNVGKIGVKTPLPSYFLHNKYELIIEKFIKNYFSSFSTNFLFLNGDSNLRQGFGGFGLLYLLDFFFIIIGLVNYFRQPTKLGKFFLWMLILAPIPFSLTRDSLSPHSTRLILMLPSLIYFVSLGINKKYYIIPLYLLSFISFWHFYTYHYPQLSAMSWHTGMKEAVLASQKYPASSIYFSNKYEPFLPFFVFYTKYLPSDSLVQHLTNVNNDFFSGQSIDNRYFFGSLNWNKSPSDQSATFIIPKSEYSSVSHPENYIIVQSIVKKYINSEEFLVLQPKLHVQP